MSNDTSVTIKDLEAQLKGNAEIVEFSQRLARLQQNPDFKSVILNFWMVTECARYAQQIENPQLSEEQRLDCQRMAAAPGHLKRWMAIVENMAGVAARSNLELETEIAEMRAADQE